MGGWRRLALNRSSQDARGALARGSLAHGPKSRSTLPRQLPQRRRGSVRFGRLGSWAVPLAGQAGTDTGPALGRTAVGHHSQPECRTWGQLPRVGGCGIRPRRVGSGLPRRQRGLSITGGALGWRSLDGGAAAAAPRPGQRPECGRHDRGRRRVGSGWIVQGPRPISAAGPSTRRTELVLCRRSGEPAQRRAERSRRLGPQRGMGCWRHKEQRWRSCLRPPDRWPKLARRPHRPRGRAERRPQRHLGGRT